MNKLFSLGVLATTVACSFNSPSNASRGQLDQKQALNNSFSSNLKQDFKETSNSPREDFIASLNIAQEDNVYTNYLTCDQSEFNYRNCYLDKAKLIDSSAQTSSFNYLINYRFSCAENDATNSLALGLRQGAKIKYFSLTGESWQTLGTFSGRVDLFTHDSSPKRTLSAIIPRTSDCQLNIKLEKRLSKSMVESTKEKIPINRF